MVFIQLTTSLRINYLRSTNVQAHGCFQFQFQFMKAFYSLSWTFLLIRAFCSFNFNNSFITLVSVVTYQTAILNNSFAMQLFDVQRCVRQGDPLSEYLFSAKSKGQGTIRFRMGHDTVLQVSNILLPDENSGIRYRYSKESDKVIFSCDYWRKRGWKFFKFFVRPRAVVAKYISKQFTVQFHLGEGESTVVLRTNCEMSLAYSP